VAGTICVDFGTSSIRAAVRASAAGEVWVCRLGDAFQSSIDSASIPSACFIGVDGTICFGQEALRRGLIGEPAILYEASPKRWLTEANIDDLEAPAVQNHGFTRLDLISGLLAQAWGAILSEMDDIPSNPALRIAHPVWTKQARGRRSALEKILRDSLEMAGQTNQPMTIVRYAELVRGLSSVARNESDIDVEEPVAAALHIHGANRHYREVCMLVDVGAGTTDIATFVSQTPTLHGSDALIFAADPISVNAAGDVIDRALVNLIQERSPAARVGAIAADLQRRQRSLKQDLFDSTQVVFDRTSVTLDELEARADIQNMASLISSAVTRQLKDAEIRLKVFRSIGAEGHINVVFAGGGARIRFIEKAVRKGVEDGPLRMPVHIDRRALEDARLPADSARLAVCMGGITPKGSWPKTRMDEPKFYRGLPV
jgi:molecular chaperone DnaK (HSP70)